MKRTYEIGNAQTIGSFEVQSNYFASVELKDGVMGVLADGAINHVNGRRAAVIAVKTCLSAFQSTERELTDTSLFEQTALQITRKVNDGIYMGKAPCLSFTGVYLKELYLSFYHAGENRLFIFDGQDIVLLKERAGRISLKKNDAVGLVSAGLYRALNEIELIHLLSGKCGLYERAQEVIYAVNRKNIKEAGNASILLIGAEPKYRFAG